MYDVIAYKKRRADRIRNRVNADREFDPSEHPRAEEGDVNSNGEKNGGQFVSKEERWKESVHSEFYDRFKRLFGSKSEEKYRIQDEIRDETRKYADSYFTKQSEHPFADQYDFVKSIVQKIPIGAELEVEWKDKSYRPKKTIFGVDAKGNLYIKSGSKRTLAKPVEKESEERFKDKFLGPMVHMHSANILYPEPDNPYGYYGYFDDNDKVDFSTINPNPSVLCTVAPDVLKSLDSSIGDIEDIATKNVLRAAIDQALVSGEYAGEKDYYGRHAYYNQQSGIIRLTEDAATTADESGIFKTGEVLAHESLHAIDYTHGIEEKKFQRPFSLTYKDGLFVKTISEQVGSFLKRFGYGTEPDENVYNAIIEFFKDKGIKRASLISLSDMMDGVTNGKFNLGFGHSGYGGYVWDDDGRATEGFAGVGESVSTNREEYDALNIAVPGVVSMWHDMCSELNSEMEEHKIRLEKQKRRLAELERKVAEMEAAGLL